MEGTQYVGPPPFFALPSRFPESPFLSFPNRLLVGLLFFINMYITMFFLFPLPCFPRDTDSNRRSCSPPSEEIHCELLVSRMLREKLRTGLCLHSTNFNIELDKSAESAGAPQPPSDAMDTNCIGVLIDSLITVRFFQFR